MEDEKVAQTTILKYLFCELGFNFTFLLVLHQ